MEATVFNGLGSLGFAQYSGDFVVAGSSITRIANDDFSDAFDGGSIGNFQVDEAVAMGAAIDCDTLADSNAR
jgi:molecular chaperone DnaK (HSP70)